MKTCPFGHTCDECLLYQERVGTDREGKTTLQKDCAINWIAEFVLMGVVKTDGVGSAVESFRNETLRSNAALGIAINRAAEENRLNHDS